MAASARPVRVVHLIPKLSRGGTERNLVKLVNALDRSAVASSICSFRPADELKTQLAADVPLVEFDTRGNDPVLVWQLARFFRRTRPDVVHTHAWGTLLEGYAACRLARVRAMVHGEHGTMELRPRNIAVQRWIWRRCDAVLSVSHSLARTMSQRVGFPEAAIAVLPNGVDCQRFKPGDPGEARRAIGLPVDRTLIGTVGRLEPVKDHALLIDAFARLVPVAAGVHLVLTGEGPLEGPLKERARALGLGDQVTFLGSRSDVDVVLAALDVFVLSSKSEGMPNAVLEAMAAGRPVVGTNVGGTAEVVEDAETGLLVPKEDPGAMAEALLRLVRGRDERISMGARGRERAVRVFSFEKMVGDYERLYAGFGQAMHNFVH